jgi:hypothetical protein
VLKEVPVKSELTFFMTNASQLMTEVGIISGQIFGRTFISGDEIWPLIVVNFENFGWR